MKQVDLGKYSESWYKPGGIAKRALWYAVNMVFFKSSMIYPNFLKVALLRLFGAKVGSGINIKPCVNIKYPWFLEIGENVWIGEEAWIDNKAKVTIGDNVCISQGAYILTNNHDYKKETFDLIIKPITIESGVWIGARAVVCPGVTLESHSVIMAGSVISKDADPYSIYKGVPAERIKQRVIEE
jgi:putative colanic acid biosynthesis acetyltransferase WcaF